MPCYSRTDLRPAASLLVRALEMTAGVNHLLVEPQCIEVIGNVIVGDRFVVACAGMQTPPRPPVETVPSG